MARTHTKTKKAKPTGKRQSDESKNASPQTTKLDILVELLSRPDGTTIAEMSEATGWLTHSVRGALAGALKRKGHVVVSEVSDGVRIYRIKTPQ